MEIQKNITNKIQLVFNIIILVIAIGAYIYGAGKLTASIQSNTIAIQKNTATIQRNEAQITLLRINKAETNNEIKNMNDKLSEISSDLKKLLQKSK